MKKCALLLFALLPLMACGQDAGDCDRVMKWYMKYYNRGYHAKICSLYADELGRTKRTIYTKEKLEQMQGTYGIIESYKLLEAYKGKTGDAMVYFKVTCTKSTHILSMILDRHEDLLNLEFKVLSYHADSLLYADEHPQEYTDQ